MVQRQALRRERGWENVAGQIAVSCHLLVTGNLQYRGKAGTAFHSQFVDLAFGLRLNPANPRLNLCGFFPYLDGLGMGCNPTQQNPV